MSKASQWIIEILAVALAIVSFFLWKNSNSLNLIVSDIGIKAKTNDSLKKVIVYRDSADAVREKVVHIHDSIQSYRLDSALHLLAINKDSLRMVKKTLQNAVSDLGQSISTLSDTSIKRKYDSVVNTLELIFTMGGTYINHSDSTIQMVIDQKNYADSLNAVLMDEIHDLKLALTTCTLNFDGLKTDADKLVAKQKSQGLLAKIEIGIGTAIGLFIGHSLK